MNIKSQSTTINFGMNAKHGLPYHARSILLVATPRPDWRVVFLTRAARDVKCHTMTAVQSVRLDLIRLSAVRKLLKTKNSKCTQIPSQLPLTQVPSSAEKEINALLRRRQEIIDKELRRAYQIIAISGRKNATSVHRASMRVTGSNRSVHCPTSFYWIHETRGHGYSLCTNNPLALSAA